MEDCQSGNGPVSKTVVRPKKPAGVQFPHPPWYNSSRGDTKIPEGPECCIIAQGLRKELELSTIISVEILSGRYTRHGLPTGFWEFKKMLPLVCDLVSVKGKFIFMTFRDDPQQEHNGGWSMWNTLGMSGIWLKEKTKFARLAIGYHSIMPPYRAGMLYFTDIRNYGTLRFSGRRDELTRKLASLGLDHLNTEHGVEETREMLGHKQNAKRTLAEVLMDQGCFAGVGNYVKSEVLWRSRLSPHRIVGSLAQTEVDSLHCNIRAVLHEAYEHNGMVLNDYASIYGKGAGFDDQRAGVFERQVYGKEMDPHGNQVVREKTKDKRVTHWVPAVQR